ncbi:septum formation family protein [Klenkia sp. PcliD-1-E]|uniref:septum formation family protein n=1 Tax=Klenkia sp. PcliD-1-E TaxID=2954492 RepID=UPI0020970CD0|nr:septum formation family protein [Klenkia sp. PcliD-1-E]MCO7221521.1 septum formation family protein [Klenkia sp. PcliD-1-E]
MRGAVLAVGAALLLAGCTSTVEGSASPAPVASPTPGDDPMVDAPAIGTCHDVESLYEPLQVPDVVDCGDGHTAETAVVADTGLPVDAEYPTQDDLDEGYLGDAFDEVCSYDTVEDYLRARPGDLLYADYAQVLPTEEQWARGARWVACDVTYGYGQPETAPGRMAGVMESGTTAAYRACLDGDPADNDVVACSQPHWAERVSGYPDVPEGTPFPADQAARAAIAEQCRPDAVDHLDGPLPAEVALDITTDDPDDWASFPFPTCVLVPAGGGTTTGSFADR